MYSACSVLNTRCVKTYGSARRTEGGGTDARRPHVGELIPLYLAVSLLTPQVARKASTKPGISS